MDIVSTSMAEKLATEILARASEHDKNGLERAGDPRRAELPRFRQRRAATYRPCVTGGPAARA
jgi:hypothetical protein